MERRVRIPARLAPYTSLIGVGLRHLLAAGGLKEQGLPEPIKQVRIKFDESELELIDRIQSRSGATFARVVTAALECATRTRLNLENAGNDSSAA